MTQLSSLRSEVDAFLDRHMLRHALRAWTIATFSVIVGFTIASHFLN